MKDKNRKRVKTVAVLNAIVVAMLAPSLIVILMYIESLIDTSLADLPIYEFVKPFVPAIVFLCPIALLVSIVLAVIGVIWSKGGVLDREYSKYNLKFEIILLVVNLLVVVTFYWIFNAANYARDHQQRYDSDLCGSHNPRDGIGVSKLACPEY